MNGSNNHHKSAAEIDGLPVFAALFCAQKCIDI